RTATPWRRNARCIQHGCHQQRRIVAVPQRGSPSVTVAAARRLPPPCARSPRLPSHVVGGSPLCARPHRCFPAVEWHIAPTAALARVGARRVHACTTTVVPIGAHSKSRLD